MPSVGLGEGIRQCLSNQSPEFNEGFFSTMQLVMAGNDSEGLRYGTTGTPEKYFLSWKEDEADNAGYKLDKYLAKLCSKARLLELLHDFVLFDGGVKKLPRVHQYFGLKAAQTHVQQRRGGIIWHTQGAGKSILMVLLARWILENRPAARVAIITDRDELDRQIERVFTDAGETILYLEAGTYETVVPPGAREVVLAAKGRHDPCVVPRAVPIVEAMAALVLIDSANDQAVSSEERERRKSDAEKKLRELK